MMECAQRVPKVPAYVQIKDAETRNFSLLARNGQLHEIGT